MSNYKIKMEENSIEWIGYLASALAVISFSLKNVKQLRIVNTIAAIIFTYYGFLIASRPVIFTNVFIIAFNLYHLKSILKTKV